ncbi:MAG TPA: c-type cytochrome, partial [Planctomycetaceae bacterium]|nr:c-type cytochrome [Planctomycetaceae bacterium]
DEINLAKKAGNFGWPMFVGPNEGYGMFDFETRKLGVRFDPANPVNPSKNNTGLKQLPPPQKPLIWYPTTESAEFPELGSGGRSILSGPVYHFDPQLKSEIKLPEAFDNCLFIGEWMRNWVKVVQLDSDAKFVRIVSLPETLVFRRPLDLRIGPEGALYTLEYGDKWNGNTDGQVTRLIYRRGNRAPRIAVQGKNTAGKTPLTASFNASKSIDPDVGDALTYEYQIGNGPVQKAKSPEFSLDFREAGVFPVKVTAVDSHGAKTSQTIDVRAGNALPRVKFLAPVDGTFFDWNQPVGTKVEVDDDEDGSSRDGKIPADRVAFRAEYYQRYPGPNGEGLDPGYALMRKTTCFGCHTSEGNSKGPAYQAVALKYKDQPTARETLAKKIITGGAGVWGAYPMPPHPQHTPEQTQQMVNWILSLASGPAPVIDAGTDAAFLAPAAPQSFLQTSADAGVYQLTASYTDQGAEGAVPLTGEASIVLHARRKKPAYADASHGVEVIHELEGEQGLVGRLSEGDHFAFRRVNLAGIAKIVCRGMQVDGDKGELVAHLDNPNGPVLARFDLHRSQFGDMAADITPPEGIHDLYFVGHGSGTSKKPLRVHWLEFQPSADVQPKLATEREALRKLITERQKQRAAAQRAFVRNWTVDDLSPKLADLDRGRSFAKGAELFRAAACANCHRVRETGGQIGPNLTEVSQRLAKKSEPRLSLLREVVEPSAVIEDKFRTLIVVTDDGQQMAGLVVAEDPTHLKLAANPARPEEVITLPKARIEESRRSDVSLMPVGLLNTLSAEEILDLLAYIESGGDATQKRFTEPRTK